MTEQVRFGPVSPGRPRGDDRADLGRAARSSVIGLAGSAIAAIAGLALNVVVGRGLGAEASGLFFVVVAVLTVAATIGRAGADTGLVWALARARALERPGEILPTLRIAVLPALGTSVILAVGVYLAAPQIGDLVDSDGALRVADLLVMSAPFLVVAGPMMVLTAGLRGLGGIVDFATVQNVLVPGLRPLLAAGAIAAGLGLTGAVLAWNVPMVLGVIIAALLVARRARRAGRGPAAEPSRRNGAVAAEFWRFSSSRAGTSILEIALTWSDVLIIAALATPAEAGIYAAASRFITTGMLAEAAMRIAMAPQISRLLALDRRDEAARLCETAAQWIVLLSWPLYLVLALHSTVVLSIFGPEFVSGATALTVLALAMLVVMALGNNQTVLLMSGRSAWQMINKALVLGLNLGLNLLLVPVWGMNGAATAWAVAILADGALAFALVRWVVGVRLNLLRVAPPAAIAILAFVPFGLVARVAPPGVLPGGEMTIACGTIGLSVVAFIGLAYLVRRRLDLVPLRTVLRRRGEVERP